MVTVDTPNIVLHGGNSAAWPERSRYLHIHDTTEPIKLLVGNGYDHFEPSRSTHQQFGVTLTVYVWSHRTYIAE